MSACLLVAPKINAICIPFNMAITYNIYKRQSLLLYCQILTCTILIFVYCATMQHTQPKKMFYLVRQHNDFCELKASQSCSKRHHDWDAQDRLTSWRSRPRPEPNIEMALAALRPESPSRLEMIASDLLPLELFTAAMTSFSVLYTASYATKTSGPHWRWSQCLTVQKTIKFR